MHSSLTMLSDRLCRDIEESSHEEKLTPATLEMLDKAVDIIKDIETIKAMEEYGDDYSEGMPRRRMSRGGYDSYGSSYNNSYGDDMMRKINNMSERDRRRVEEYMRQM